LRYLRFPGTCQKSSIEQALQADGPAAASYTFERRYLTADTVRKALQAGRGHAGDPQESDPGARARFMQSAMALPIFAPGSQSTSEYENRFGTKGE
jgi:hypothetical protein